MAQICPFCGSQIALVARHALYPGQSGWLYLCVRFPDCDSRVGCHPGTIVPLGSLADPELRRLRSLCHKHFDQLWRSGRQSRSQAYRWLAAAMGLPHESAHFGWFDKAQCKAALTHIQSFEEQLNYERNSVSTRERIWQSACANCGTQQGIPCPAENTGHGFWLDTFE